MEAYEYVRAGEVLGELGEMKLIDSYNPVTSFYHCVEGAFPSFSNKQEIIANTKSGKVLFTTDISSFRKTLEDLADGTLQRELRMQSRELAKANVSQIKELVPKEFKFPEGARGKEILGKIKASPDLQAMLGANLGSKKEHVMLLAAMQDDSMYRLHETLRNEHKGEKLYEDIVEVWEDPKKLSAAVSVLKGYKAKLERVLEEEDELNRKKKIGLQVDLGFVNLVLSRLKVFDGVRENDFSYFEVRYCLDASEVSTIKPKYARNMLDAIDGACKYYAENAVVDVFKQFGIYCKNTAPDLLIFPFGKNFFYVGSTEKVESAPETKTLEEALKGEGKVIESQGHKMDVIAFGSDFYDKKDGEKLIPEAPLYAEALKAYENPEFLLKVWYNYDSETTQKVFKTIVTT